jgi:Flp pilus assembly protein TadD
MRFRFLLAAGLGAAVLCLLLYLRWRQADPLPEVDLTGAEPDVRALLEGVRQDVARAPSSAEAWGRWGKALLANGYDDDAMGVLERAARLDPAEPRWPYLRARRLRTIDRVRGRELLEHAVALAGKADPDNVAPKLLLAEALSEQGGHDRASALAQEVLAKEPDNPRAHFYLGVGCAQRDELRESLAHLLRAAESPFCRRRACNQLAAVSLRLGQRSAAEQFARQARELPEDLPPIDPYVAEYQVLAAGRQKKFAEAERLAGERRLGESAAVLREMADAFPDARSEVALGTALVKLGDNVGAEAVLRKAVAEGPASPAAYYALAVAQFNQAEGLRGQGRPGQAADKYRQAEQSALGALRGKADHAMAHLYLGRARGRLGRRDEAVAAYRRAIACRPELAGPHLSLGEALAEAGERAEARRELGQAAALAGPHDPAGPEARAALQRLGKP